MRRCGGWATVRLLSRDEMRGSEHPVARPRRSEPIEGGPRSFTASSCAHLPKALPRNVGGANHHGWLGRAKHRPVVGTGCRMRTKAPAPTHLEEGNTESINSTSGATWSRDSVDRWVGNPPARIRTTSPRRFASPTWRGNTGRVRRNCSDRRRRAAGARGPRLQRLRPQPKARTNWASSGAVADSRRSCLPQAEATSGAERSGTGLTRTKLRFSASSRSDAASSRGSSGRKAIQTAPCSSEWTAASSATGAA